MFPARSPPPAPATPGPAPGATPRRPTSSRGSSTSWRADPIPPRTPKKDHALFGPAATQEVITSLKPVRADAGRITVRVGRRSVGVISVEAARNLGLARGTPFTPALAERIRAASDELRARRLALRSLASRPRSRKELTDRLARAGAAKDTAQKVADSMERLGLVNDDAYAREVVRSVTRSRPAGARLLRAKLASRGIDAERTARALKDAAAESNPLKDATALAHKRSAQLPASLDARARARRLLGLLARRGFEADIASQAVRAALGAAAPDDGE